MLLIYYMMKDYIKIINFGNNYLIHITPEMDIVVNRSYIYKNTYMLSSYDIFFGKVSNILRNHLFSVKYTVKLRKVAYI